MHAAGDIRNRDRTLMVWLTALNLGAQLVPPGDDTAPTAAQAKWIRVQVDEVSASGAGFRSTGTRVAASQLLITFDVFVRGQQLGEVSVDGVDDIAGRLRSALTAASLPLLDFVADASGATTLAGCAIRFHEPPTVRPLLAVSGIQRRQVLAPAIYLHEV